MAGPIGASPIGATSTGPVGATAVGRYGETELRAAPSAYVHVLDQRGEFFRQAPAARHLRSGVGVRPTEALVFQFRKGTHVMNFTLFI